MWFYELNRRNLEPYVLAYDRTRAREVRVYKLARMHRAHLLQDRYEIPDRFDPHAHMDGSWGIVVGDPVTVRLRVDASVAFWFREHRGREPSLTIEREHDDGSLDVDLHGHLAAGGDLHELLSFLLGWGSRIEVLGPPEIRARVADEVARAARRYADG